MPINKGTFKDDIYIKYINSNDAVLWMSKELSLPLDIVATARKKDISKFYFIDKTKDTVWAFEPGVVFGGTKKAVGQEKQYYFPIDKADEFSYRRYKEVLKL